MSWLYRRGGKRLLDLALAAAGLACLSLPMAWIACRIRVDRGGPVLLRQPRVGRGGIPFLLLKFRTMEPPAPPLPWAARLRATALDELPQLINILRGQMSFVGPRPLIPEEAAELARLPEGTRRQSVRPGLTGLAQLRAPKRPDPAERIGWDLRYVEEHSPRMDLSILLQSVGVTLRGSWE